MISGQVMSQTELPNYILDQIENTLEDDTEVDLFEIFNLLESFKENPLNINKADYTILKELNLLSDFQILAIIKHRQTFGDFLEIEELQSITALTKDEIKVIQPFIAVNNNDRLQLGFSEIIGESSKDLFIKWGTTLEDKLGYSEPCSENPSKYCGDKNKLNLRFRGNFENRVQFGFILEKDEGEKIWLNGPDYASAHIYLRDYSSTLRALAIGDFTFSLGQGLISNSGYGGGKSAFSMQIKRGNRVKDLTALSMRTDSLEEVQLV